MTPGRRQAVLVLAALVGTTTTARLGFWQLDRAAQKEALQTTREARRLLLPLPASELARSEAEAAGQHQRRTSLDGRWLGERTVYLDNRPMVGRVGFIVVTPLLLSDGSAVAVQRGWLPRDMLDRTRTVAPAPPFGQQAVAGRIAPPPSRLFQFGEAGSGVIRQNLDFVAYAAEVGHPLRPLSLVLEDGPPTIPDGLLRQWPAPAADVHKHYGYAFQWFSMATLIAGLYVWFQLIRPRRHR